MIESPTVTQNLIPPFPTRSLSSPPTHFIASPGAALVKDGCLLLARLLLLLLYHLVYSAWLLSLWYERAYVYRGFKMVHLSAWLEKYLFVFFWNGLEGAAVALEVQ